MFGQMSDAFVGHKETWQQVGKLFHYFWGEFGARGWTQGSWALDYYFNNRDVGSFVLDTCIVNKTCTFALFRIIGS